ncbi:TIGR02117 family protein [Hymenobacter sp. B81]|uniref:TIGR02117 family protein n=1 Tax=Hymenobacter sp. B81 TaxID=3344878 RepID=UPI0037DD451C
MTTFTRGLRLLMSVFAALIALLMAGTLVPRNGDFRQTPGGIRIFVVSNGFHTDLVLPARELQTGTDWLAHLPQPGFERFGAARYVSFGWGNEAFYLESYGGRLPRAGTIARALLPARTLMHVGFRHQAPDSGRYVVPLRISAAQYRQLSGYVAQSFLSDSVGRWTLRNAQGYGEADFFFPARGRYHALRTCNDWTNQGLHHAGLRAALKAPLAASVLFQARRAASR